MDSIGYLSQKTQLTDIKFGRLGHHQDLQLAHMMMT
jgi:hypothetical protein